MLIKLKWNKFEVSKIYMIACICFYKFCQIKGYFLMIFSCFIQKIEWYFYDSSWFFMFHSRSWIIFYYVLLKNIHVFMNFSRFSWIEVFSSFWCFIQVSHVLFKFYSSLCLIKDSIFIYKLWSKSAYNYAHTIMQKCIQVGLITYK